LARKDFVFISSDKFMFLTNFVKKGTQSEHN